MPSSATKRDAEVAAVALALRVLKPAMHDLARSGVSAAEFEQEEDGRWLADIPELSGVMAYVATKRDAEVAAVALALRVLAD